MYKPQYPANWKIPTTICFSKIILNSDPLTFVQVNDDWTVLIISFQYFGMVCFVKSYTVFFYIDVFCCLFCDRHCAIYPHYIYKAQYHTLLWNDYVQGYCVYVLEINPNYSKGLARLGVTERVIGSFDVTKVEWRPSWIDGVGLHDVIETKQTPVLLIWIQTVYFWKNFRKSWIWKKTTDDKNFAKLPSRQKPESDQFLPRINWWHITESSRHLVYAFFKKITWGITYWSFVQSFLIMGYMAVIFHIVQTIY